MRILKLFTAVLVMSGALLATTPCAAMEVGGQDYTVEEAEQKMADQHFISGLDVAWWFDGGKLVGPALMWGLILVPEKLEMELTIHSLVGGKTNSIPIDLMFKVPFRVGLWFVPYIGVGPMLIIDRERNRTEHDWAAASAAGIGLNLPGFNWRFYIEGNYNFRFWQDTVHQGGFTFGFQYRF